MVLGLQGYNILVDFGSEETLGVMVSLSLVRELGPVVAALCLPVVPFLLYLLRLVLCKQRYTFQQWK